MTNMVVIRNIGYYLWRPAKLKKMWHFDFFCEHRTICGWKFQNAMPTVFIWSQPNVMRTLLAASDYRLLPFLAISQVLKCYGTSKIVHLYNTKRNVRIFKTLPLPQFSSNFNFMENMVMKEEYRLAVTFWQCAKLKKYTARWRCHPSNTAISHKPILVSSSKRSGRDSSRWASWS